ncbi:chymotrypsin-1-like [Toxorhynchites rutilus septentrionalis]|uniref:chymotrypsin-1-like n=1 Tax=Toxorhynchites rutilus septentrionalis TaxID=329112 RepID=UPI00247AD0E0|nr:chymotrypsin-1-like [Toxorhynchites rutilus septentrionalis]
MLRTVSIVVFALIGSTLAGALPNRIYLGRGRIVGGSNAIEGQFPFQVSLRSSDGIHFCGGTIIDNRWILTAAHCTIGRAPTQMVVVAGTLLLSSGGTTHQVLRVVYHPHFSLTRWENDVSLVELTTPIVFTNNVGPVELEASFVNEASGAQAAGWGLTSNPGSASNHLQWIEATIISLAACREAYSPDNADHVYDNTICTSSPVGIGICSGDAGGPLMLGGRQQGIASWGVPCAVGYPDVFARVSSHRSWILETVA